MSVAFRRESDEEHLEPKFERPIAPGPNLVTPRGLALIGAIVAEYVAGISGSGSGLAFRILEASYRLNYPRMFAALIMIAVVGVIIFAATSFLSWVFLRKWHESAIRRET